MYEQAASNWLYSKKPPPSRPQSPTPSHHLPFHRRRFKDPSHYRRPYPPPPMHRRPMMHRRPTYSASHEPHNNQRRPGYSGSYETNQRPMYPSHPMYPKHGKPSYRMNMPHRNGPRPMHPGRSGERRGHPPPLRRPMFPEKAVTRASVTQEPETTETTVEPFPLMIMPEQYDDFLNQATLYKIHPEVEASGY